MKDLRQQMQELDDNLRQAGQLYQIARLELETPLEAARCLIVGEGELTDCLASRFQPVVQTMTCTAQCEAGSGEKYGLIVLLRTAEPQSLADLAEQEALVIDASAEGKNDWNIYDAKAGYRRIRVLRLASRGCLRDR